MKEEDQSMEFLEESDDEQHKEHQNLKEEEIFEKEEVDLDNGSRTIEEKFEKKTYSEAETEPKNSETFGRKGSSESVSSSLKGSKDFAGR